MSHFELGSTAHEPAEQISYDLPQLEQAAPPWPHMLLLVPGMQVLPSQQPWQLAGPQEGGEEQFPPLHVPPPALQSRQGVPP